jgi:hypothetical protein
MNMVAAMTRELGGILLDTKVTVQMISAPQADVTATWSDRTLTFNVGRLGEAWFEDSPTEAQISLIIHEFGHHFASDHLSEKYYRALTNLAAKLAFEAANNPSLLVLFGRDT